MAAAPNSWVSATGNMTATAFVAVYDSNHTPRKRRRPPCGSQPSEAMPRRLAWWTRCVPVAAASPPTGAGARTARRGTGARSRGAHRHAIGQAASRASDAPRKAVWGSRAQAPASSNPAIWPALTNPCSTPIRSSHSSSGQCPTMKMVPTMLVATTPKPPTKARAACGNAPSTKENAPIAAALSGSPANTRRR